MKFKEIWERILDFFGLSNTQKEGYYEEVDDERVVSIYRKKQGFSIMIYHPESFNEVQNLVDEIKAKKPIILNLEELDRELARRIIDFMSGAVYGIGGNIQKVAEHIFVFTPHNIDIDSGVLKEDRSLFS